MHNQVPHLLIVDDDVRILKLLERFFLKNNFLVSTALDITKAEEIIAHFTFDLIILDVMLPNISGLEFAKILRARLSPLPIVMLTALSDPSDRIRGLEAGASDYLTKPFEPDELLLRVNNLLKNRYKEVEVRNIVHIGSNIYNIKNKHLSRQGKYIALSSTEQKLFEALVDQIGTTISRENLCKIMGDLNERSIDVQINRLRAKIEHDPKIPKHLKTIRNIGYALYR